MKKLAIIAISLCLFGQAMAQQYDVCIYGGTSAGVIAAYTVAKMHKSVILIEPGKYLGGLTSGGLGYTDIGNKYAITGLARDFYRRMGKHYGTFEQWVFEPHVATEVFNSYIKEANVEVLFGYRLRKCLLENGYINGIDLNDSSGKAEKFITAKMFIDCSYEGDLMALSKVPYAVGREANSKYNETWDGVELLDKHQFPDSVDPYKIPGDSTSGLLWGISSNKLQPNGTGDDKVQTYNYRICLSNDPANMIPITKPAGYESSMYELLARLIHAQPNKQQLSNYLFFGLMPNHKCDINNNGGFSTDMIGVNYAYPDGSYNERQAIIKKHEFYTKGLLWFLGHDTKVPENMRNEMLQWGYPKDEYGDNNYWSPQLYLRECRRMFGMYVMTQANCESREVVSDGVGMAAYTMDSHNCERLVVNGMVKNEGDVQKGGFGPYPISYRSLISDRCTNLLVPVCLSASHIAYGSIRMEPVFMVLAQSSAVAACMAIDAQQTVQQVDVKKLQAFLKNDPLVDGSTPEVLSQIADNTGVAITGNWQKMKSGGYGPQWLLASPTTPASAKFAPRIKTAGTYTLYSYIPTVDSAASQTHYTIYNGKASKDTMLTTHVTVEGQTSGEWVCLGAYYISAGESSYVTISNANADGHITANAILFVPVKKG